MNIVHVNGVQVWPFFTVYFNIDEIIIAIGTSVEGETTSLYLINLLEPLNIKISRLSQGLPVGGQLEYIDQATLEKSFIERVKIN